MIQAGGIASNNPHVDRKSKHYNQAQANNSSIRPLTQTSRHTLPNQLRKSRPLTQDRFAGAVLAEVPLNGRIVVAREGVVDEKVLDLLVEAVAPVETIDRRPVDCRSCPPRPSLRGVRRPSSLVATWDSR
jgi:hypothetical protein